MSHFWKIDSIQHQNILENTAGPFSGQRQRQRNKQKILDKMRSRSPYSLMRNPGSWQLKTKKKRNQRKSKGRSSRRGSEEEEERSSNVLRRSIRRLNKEFVDDRDDITEQDSSQEDSEMMEESCLYVEELEAVREGCQSGMEGCHTGCSYSFETAEVFGGLLTEVFDVISDLMFAPMVEEYKMVLVEKQC